MTRENFKPGTMPSPDDNRDFTVAMALTALRTVALQSFPRRIFSPYPGKVQDQGNIGACVAYSSIEERMISEQLQTGRVMQFSPGYRYVERSASLYQGEGMVTRDALSSMRFHGSVLFEDFPYIDTYTALKEKYTPMAEALEKKAEPYRISSYFRLDVPGEDLITNIKNALINNMLVFTCIDVHESFWDVGADGIVPIPKAYEKNYGGHCMLTCGTDDDIGGGTTITLNHWGEEWGDSGWCHIPYDYPFKEVWAVSDKIDANLVKLQNKFTDANIVSTWAREAVLRATELGLMAGDGVRFNPQGGMSREQMAVVVTKLYDKIKSEVGGV